MLKTVMAMTIAGVTAMAALGLEAGAAPAPGSAGQGPQVSRFTLANGLDVVVIPDRRAPVVTHMIWYRVGAADEPEGKSGIAHFLEHLMFKGTAKHPAGEFSKVVAEIGGQENAFTSQDYTAYFQRVAREHLRTVMAFEADRMTGLVLTDEVVAPERDVVLEERRMRVDSDPAAQLSETLGATLYLHHPYGTPIIGWKSEIEKLNREDALAFYRRFYTPQNAILVVAGDIDPDEVKRLAEETYGKVAPNGEAVTGPRERVREPEPLAARRVTLADEKVRQPTLQRSYLAPSYRMAAPGEAEALDVLAQVIGSPTTGVLHRKLVLDRKLAVSVGAWYGGTAWDQTRFGIYAVPREGTSLDQLDRAIDEVIAEVVTSGVPERDVERAKSRLIAEAIYDRDSQSTLARVFGVALTTGLSIDDVTQWPSRIEKVTADDVRQAAARWLEKRRSATGFLEPAARAN
jgi:zinc protease